MLEPFEFLTRPYKKLHLHLLELPHPKDELTCHYFITECFPYLGNTERNLHPAGFLYIQEVHKNSLGCFGPQVNDAGIFTYAPHLGREHQVKLTNLGPVPGTRYRACNFAINDQLPDSFQVIAVEGLVHPHFNLIGLLLVPQNIWVGCTELCLIKCLSEFLAPLLYILFYLLLYLGNIILKQYICTISFLGIFVVNQRIVKSPDMARSLPNFRMHENCRVNPYNVVVKPYHGVPPILLYVVFKLNSQLPVIINRT
ncbi:hypothetical protein SDC9_111157 [bioreactor metagenome]|uniref:Uncharacterized protein n=1 Tax=bioreactor metagenome TaxID=1076179 RepID=A0A645BI82_9ZZZZ